MKGYASLNHTEWDCKDPVAFILKRRKKLPFYLFPNIVIRTLKGLRVPQREGGFATAFLPEING
jgi:hypothetical protein